MYKYASPNVSPVSDRTSRRNRCTSADTTISGTDIMNIFQTRMFTEHPYTVLKVTVRLRYCDQVGKRITTSLFFPVNIITKQKNVISLPCNLSRNRRHARVRSDDLLFGTGYTCMSNQVSSAKYATGKYININLGSLNIIKCNVEGT